MNSSSLNRINKRAMEGQRQKSHPSGTMNISLILIWISNQSNQIFIDFQYTSDTLHNKS